MGRLTFNGLVMRFLASLILVVATYNPSGYSYFSWVAGIFPHLLPVQALVGVVLLGLWIFFLHATWRSLGSIGVALGIAFFAALLWVINSWGWLNGSNHEAFTWIVLLVIATLLTAGLCWALIRVRVSGQAVIEEVRR